MAHESINRPNQPTRRIALGETVRFDRGDFSGEVYVGKDDKAGFSALLVSVNGRHPRKRMIDTTRTYFVVDGTGQFTLNGDIHKVNKGDFYVIPPGNEYEYSGEMKLFEVNISPDNSFRDEKLE